jgi:hypothetical protein
MLKYILIFTLFSSSCFAQISIDENDLFDANDTARISVDNNFSVDFSSTGPNSNWDYSQLAVQEQRVEEAFSIASGGLIISFQFGSFAPFSYRSDYFQPFEGLPLDQFGGALPVNIEDINRIVKKTNSALTFPGYSLTVEGQQIGFRSDTIERIYQLPLNYNDTYSSRGYTEMDLNPAFDGTYSLYRQRNSEVDGYGSITLPNNTYNDVLRIHHTINQQDSLYLGALGNWFGFSRTIHEYEWWAKNEMRPVLRITTNEVLGFETVTEITYRDIDLELDASLNQEDIVNASLYPNPASGMLTIESEQPMQQINIFNSTGKQVFQKSVNSSTQQLDLSSFSTGLYSVVIITSKGIRRSKLIVE